MSKIYAKKTLGGRKGSKKTVARQFEKNAWDRMGKDKGGWDICSEADFLKLNPKKNPNKVVVPAKKVEKPDEVKNEGGEGKGEGEEGEEGKGKGEGGEEIKKEGIADITIPDVIVHLKTLNTPEEIDAYVGKDDRKGVKSAVASRKEELEEAAK